MKHRGARSGVDPSRRVPSTRCSSVPLLSATLSFSPPFGLAARDSRRVEAGLPRVYRSFPFPQILATVGRLVGGARLGTSGGGFAARLPLDQLNEKLPFLALLALCGLFLARVGC